jgi:hypothetical protein
VSEFVKAGLKTHPPAPVENAPAPDRGARLRS